MKALPYWNHNAAYWPRIARLIGDAGRVLDVGCGDGTLAAYLSRPGRVVTGIDPFRSCAEAARDRTKESGARILERSFEEFDAPPGSFDAVIFSASLHHMDMEPSLIKAAGLLAEEGKLVVLGLARPSRARDYLIDCLRVVPARIGQAAHRMRSAEELDIPTSYDLPGMDEVRRAARAILPGARLRTGLYWRYLLFWSK